MTYADTISMHTAQFDPEIERHANGDLTFYWRQFVPSETINEALGLEDMVGCLADGTPCLHVPKAIAEQVMA